MSSAADVARLRARARKILCSPHCNYSIRFKLENIRIQTLQFGYVGDLISRGKINIEIGSGNGYDHVSNTIYLRDVDVEAHAIVHEATHAIIDATHPRITVMKGHAEAAAYLAEMVYAVVTTGDAVDLEVPYLTRPVWQLAKKVIATGSKSTYTCPSDDVANIVALLQNSRLAGDMQRLDRMDNIPWR